VLATSRLCRHNTHPERVFGVIRLVQRPALPDWLSRLRSDRAWAKVMFRGRLIVAIAVVGLAPALAACSGSSLTTYLPDWLQFKPAAPPTQDLQFDSQPPGADARTAQGQVCMTPCTLPVPATAQAVTFVLTGYISQTVQVEPNQSGDLMPNPVIATLQPIPPPPRPVRKPPHRKPPPRTAAQPAPPPPPPGGMPPPAQAAPPSSSSPFPPPPTR
jgi:hypothetical protein